MSGDDRALATADRDTGARIQPERSHPGHGRFRSDDLADELGLEPSVALQRLELDILRRGVEPPPGAAAPAALDRLRARYIRRHDGHKVAVAVVGTGPPLVVVPAWVTSLELVASGRDPRVSLLERLARRTRLTLYDRLGTGLSRGPAVPDHGLDASTAELEAAGDLKLQTRPSRDPVQSRLG